MPTPAIRTIAISTGGGDCPGLNAVIRGVVKSAVLQHRWQILGVQDGFDGLIWPEKCRELKLPDVSGILPRGGTILGTTNRGDPFQYKQVEGGHEVLHDYSDLVISNARKLGIGAVIVVGGDGTQKIGLDLYKKGLMVVGVPKTIDNDLSATEVSFGFDTALHTATDAIDKIHTTAESHHRIMLVELMGRDTGWIALEAGIAGGAHAILIPEIPFSIEKLCEFVEQRDRIGKRFTIITVAEGVEVPRHFPAWPGQERRAASRSGTVGNRIGEAMHACLRREVRVTVLGHIQRGGSPSPFDRILSTRFGVAAVDLIARGRFGRMVCLRHAEIADVDIAEAVTMKRVDPAGDLVRTARAIGICFGD